MATLVKKKNARRIAKKGAGTGIPELVMKLKSRMSAKDIDAQLKKQRMND